MAKHVFKSAVIHDGVTYISGQFCPEEILDLMKKKDFVIPLADGSKAGQPMSASDAELKAASEMKHKADSAKSKK